MLILVCTKTINLSNKQNNPSLKQWFHNITSKIVRVRLYHHIQIFSVTIATNHIFFFCLYSCLPCSCFIQQRLLQIRYFIISKFYARITLIVSCTTIYRGYITRQMYVNCKTHPNIAINIFYNCPDLISSVLLLDANWMTVVSGSTDMIW